MAARIRDNRGKLDALKKRVADARLKLTVGLHSEEAGQGAGDLTLGDVGAFHEFGLGNPQRSFVGSWADAQAARSHDDMRKLGVALVKGRVPNARTGLHAIGLVYRGEMQERISAGIDPPLADSTVARKGSSTPLIDTGQLRAGLRHKVVAQ